MKTFILIALLSARLTHSYPCLFRVTTVVFDKTGTLTTGRPSVTDELVLRDSELRAKGIVDLLLLFLSISLCLFQCCRV